MVWETPSLLFALWLVPLAGAGALYAHRKRTAAAAQFADQEMAARLMPASMAFSRVHAAASV